MKVKELIRELQKFDPEKEVVIAGNNMESPCEINDIIELNKNFKYYNISDKDNGKIIIDNG
jgi:hypothetical protein